MANDKHPSESTNDSRGAILPGRPEELIDFAFDSGSGVAIRTPMPDDPDHKVAFEILSQPLSRMDLVPLVVAALQESRGRAYKDALKEVRAAVDFLGSVRR